MTLNVLVRGNINDVIKDSIVASASSQMLEDVLKGSISLDFSIYNRDEELYIHIINEDGYLICDGKINHSINENEKINCIYDTDLLKNGDNTFFITVYSVRKNNIVLQTTSHFYYNKGLLSYQSKIINNIIKNKNKWMIVAISILVGSSTTYYFQSKSSKLQLINKNNNNPFQISKPVIYKKSNNLNNIYTSLKNKSSQILHTNTIRYSAFLLGGFLFLSKSKVDSTKKISTNKNSITNNNKDIPIYYINKSPPTSNKININNNIKKYIQSINIDTNQIIYKLFIATTIMLTQNILILFKITPVTHNNIVNNNIPNNFIPLFK